MSSPKIIVALDYSDAVSALAFAKQVSPEVCILKVGKELFTAAGPQLVEKLVQQDFKVFLDLKYHDIPYTVAKACKAAANLGVWMFNVHAFGGERMLLAAREAVDSVVGEKPLLIGVTILTSMELGDLSTLSIGGTVAENVEKLAKLSKQASLDGVVCSSHEILPLRQVCGEDFCLVTPGIRPTDYQTKDDQRRVMTPEQAITQGANYLVIGRPITQAKDPLQTLIKINKSINQQF